MTRSRDLSNLIGYKTSDNQETLTATAGQTSFAVTDGYTAGFINVFMNGFLLDPVVDYAATDGTNIVLTDAAEAGDELEVLKYQTYNASDVFRTSGGTISGDVTFNANLNFTAIAQIYGNGTQTNPFKGLDGANAYATKAAIADGDYYIDFNGTTYQMPFVFNNFMAARMNYNKPGPRAWMKIKSGFGTLTSLQAGSGISVPGDVNAQIDSAGVITMDYIENTGCGETHCTYKIDLPDGCGYNYAQMNVYRPHSLHQCFNIHEDCNSDFTRPSGTLTSRIIAIFGAATVDQFYDGGTNTQASNNPTDDGGGPNVSQCSWSSSIHADNGGGSAATTTYDYLATCSFYLMPRTFENIVAHYNCASESSIAQTNTTHEYWIAA